ncbi:GDSL esterase/lipase [Rhynchospora pubera]|uniref:GDSL esterase/lipase n=1 Tax=Rhynchospora pubera TaxID=906938 RepID=A0AAV8CBX0_9POAL|nr:GDSL esterase/lipase [Rhynchospora pubera]
MASWYVFFPLHIYTLSLLLILTKPGDCCFTHIFCFGDSISDTGNYLKSIGDRYHPVGSLPYGETYFGRPTGRYSDGRIILDFIAQAYGLPFIPPYLSGNTTKDFPHGVNFAVGGATALNSFAITAAIDLTISVQSQK